MSGGLFVTLIVNLFAGPGAGKSTMAATVFARLKQRGVCAEMALEFAKDLTWERRFNAMECQPYVFGEQLWRLQRLVNANVPVVITDSPLLLSTVYGKGMPESFRDAVRTIAAQFESLNFMVTRVKPYDPRGRRQNEESAREVDGEVEVALRLSGVFARPVTGDEAGATRVVWKVLERLNAASEAAA
jgi:hypothetical protein